MAELTYRDAVAAGIAQEMRRDPDVVFLGEDIGAAGGVFKATVGLFEEFGPRRVRDTPISEQAILGAAMGAAMAARLRGRLWDEDGGESEGAREVGALRRDLGEALAASADLDLPRLKTAFPLVEDHDLPLACVDHGALGNGENLLPAASLDLDVGEHVAE